MKSVPQFKARPVSARVLQSSGDLGVPRVPKQPPTEPLEFHLSTATRTRPVHAPQPPPQAEFKARPLDPSLFEGPVGVRAVAPPPLTVPVSPPLSKPERKRKSPEVQPAFKARPMPVFERPQLLASQQKRARQLTQPEPFHLESEERRLKHEAQLAAQLEQQRHEEAERAQFRARPMRVDSPLQPQPSSRPLTLPEPFDLKSAELAERARAAAQERAMREHVELAAGFDSFRARPVPAFVTGASPAAAVHKSEKPLTEIDDFTLPSEQRAAQRRAFDARQAEKQRLAEQQRQQQLQAKLAREKAEVARLRMQMVPKARPVLKAQPLAVNRSEKRLTEPVSPKFSTKQRALVRTARDENSRLAVPDHVTF